MKDELKKKIIGGGVAAVVTGASIVTLSVMKNVGDGIGEGVKPIVKEVAHKHVNELIHTESEVSAPVVVSSVSEPINIVPIAIPSFDDDYQACDDQNKQNPKIDINNSIELYEANIYCLLTQKNQGTELDKRAETNKDLQMILQKIRQSKP